MNPIKKKRIIGSALISMTIVSMFSGCVSKGNPGGTSQENATETVLSDNKVTEDEQMVPSEIERTGAIGGYLFIPIEGKVFRYNVSSGVVGAKKNKLIFSFVEDASGTSYEHSIYSLEGHDDYRTLADCYKESGSDFTDEVQLEYMPALKAEEGELDKAIESGFVIMENGSVTHGKEKWISFYEKVTAGETAEIRLGYYYPLEGQGQMSSDLYEATKEDYPTFYMRELCYDGTEFVIRPLHRGENGYFVYEQKGIDTPETSWKYLKHFTGQQPDYWDARYRTYDMYVLVNADDVTWKKLFYGSISSTAGDYIPYDTVFCEYEWK